jgi:hypothetical protein
MLKTVEGVCRDGKIELLEPAPQNEARVLVIFLPACGPIDLASRGISPAQAADLRFRLGTIMEDWNDPAMDVYDEM